MIKKYQITAKGKGKAEVLIYDDIGAGWMGGISAKSFATELNAMGKLDEINVRINSNGGSVFDGVAIYNSLIKNSARVVVDIDGIAASIASIIAMAGDEIRMADNAFLMIHDPWIVTGGTADDLRTVAETMDKVRETLLDTYAKRPGSDRDHISQWMTDETWFTASEALDAGLIDSVAAEMKLAAFAGVDLSKYKKAPVALASVVTEAMKEIHQPRLLSTMAKITHIKNRVLKEKM